MTDVIDFFIWIWGQLFTLIKNYWILGGFFLLSVMKFIVDIVKVSKSD